MWPLEEFILRRQREGVYPYLSGCVLEIGVGTGANLGLYRAAERVVALDIDAGMLRWACQGSFEVMVDFVRADAAALPFADASFDYVTGSLVFCSVPDPDGTLRDVRRVLRTGGHLVLIEHVRGAKPLARWLTDCLARPWARWSKQCRIDRETSGALKRAGFELEKVVWLGLGIFQLLIGRSP